MRTKSLIGATETPHGADIRYRRSAIAHAELARLVEAERECCAKGDIAWDLIEQADALTVRITFPEALRSSREATTIFNALAGDDHHP